LAAILIFGSFLGRQKLWTQPPKISQPPNVGIIFGSFKVGPPKTNGPPEVVKIFLLPPGPRPTTVPYSLHTRSHRLELSPAPSPPTLSRRAHQLPPPARARPPPSQCHPAPASPGRAPPQLPVTERVASLRSQPHRRASHRPPPPSSRLAPRHPPRCRSGPNVAHPHAAIADHHRLRGGEVLDAI
jgi:hypothetical protein